MAIDVGSWLSQSGAAVSGSDPCGLFIDGSSAAVPLKRRDVRAEVCTDACYADTKETFSYISDVDCTATFKFPLPPRSAVYSFVARIGEREVVTRVKPRAQAYEEYQLAVGQGHTAVLLSQSPSSASLYEVAVGNLEAHTEAVVELRYLRLLDAMGDAVEWVHTATWVPPYTGSAGDVAAGLDKVAAAEPKFSSSVPYSLSYAVTVRSDTATVKSIESPEPITTTQLSPTTHLVTLAEQVAQPSKDFTLLIERAPGARHSALRVERVPAGPTRPGGPRTVAMATFVPRLDELPVAGAGAAAAAAATASPAVQQELWLVVDCSGSMGGSPIKQARDAALFFVRDLPAAGGVRFNITCFGSSHTSLYDTPRPYGADTERQAVSWIQQHVHASMGGTEILSTLQHIYASPVAPGYSRQVIFLTDGGISGHEEQAVYDLVAKGAAPTAMGGVEASFGRAPAGRPSVLCLGIGHGVHRGLLDSMASRSGGLAAYVVDDEDIAKKAAFLKKCATAQGVLARPRLTARGALVRAVPHVMPTRIFAGEPLHVLLEVLSSTQDATLELTADLPTATGAFTTLTFTLPLGAAAAAAEAEPAAAPSTPTGGCSRSALSVLHGMAYIGSLLSGSSPLHLKPDGSPVSPPPSADTVKDSVVALAVAEHLVTPHTSAVGVLLQRDPIDSAAVRQVEVPLAAPAGRSMWQQQQQQPEDLRSRMMQNSTAPGCAAPLMMYSCKQSRSAFGFGSAAPRPALGFGSAAPRPTFGFGSAAPGAAQETALFSGKAVGGGFMQGLFSRMAFGAAAPPPPPSMMRCAAADPFSSGATAVPLAACAAAPGFGAQQQQLQASTAVNFGAAPHQQASTAVNFGAAPHLQASTAVNFGAAPHLQASTAVNFGAAPHLQASTAANFGAAPHLQASTAVNFGAAPYQQASTAVYFGAAPHLQASTAVNFGAAPRLQASTAVPFVPFSPCDAMEMELLSYEEEDEAMEDDVATATGALSASPSTNSNSVATSKAASADERTAEGGASPKRVTMLPPGQLLSFLNLSRTTEGYWCATQQLAEALGLSKEDVVVGPAAAAPSDGSSSAALASARPGGLSDDAWSTVLVLSALRKHLAAQREVWADMEAKALGWLTGVWPPVGAKSAAATVLALVKLVP